MTLPIRAVAPTPPVAAPYERPLLPLGPLAAGFSFVQLATEWFGPNQPVPKQAPADNPPRELDYPVGYNLQYLPRAELDITFLQLKTLAVLDNLTRTIIETRKDQVCGLEWVIRPRREPGELSQDYKKRVEPEDPNVLRAVEIFKRPDGSNSYQDWMRRAVEEVLVTDALSIIPQNGGKEFDLIDGSTIKPLVDSAGREPRRPGDVTHQQIIKGVPAFDFKKGELLYRPRNRLPGRIYGFPPVEQIIYVMNLSLRRDLFKLAYYTEGNLPEAIIQMPENWPIDKIKGFSNWFNSVLSGQLEQRRKAFFIPGIGGDKAISYPKQDALKDDYDEWLARQKCFAFSIPPSAFVRQMNRATAQTAQETATAEGLRPLLLWLKGIMDELLLIAGFENLEWSWDQDITPDPLKRAQIQEIQVRNGIKSPDEIREDNGDDPIGLGPGVITASGFVELTTSAEAAKHPQPTMIAPPGGEPKRLAPGESQPPKGATQPSSSADGETRAGAETGSETPVSKAAGDAAAFSSTHGQARLTTGERLVARHLKRIGRATAHRLAQSYAAALKE